jgi:hypothetical protein
LSDVIGTARLNFCQPDFLSEAYNCFGFVHGLVFSTSTFGALAHGQSFIIVIRHAIAIFNASISSKNCRRNFEKSVASFVTVAVLALRRFQTYSIFDVLSDCLEFLSESHGIFDWLIIAMNFFAITRLTGFLLSEAGIIEPSACRLHCRVICGHLHNFAVLLGGTSEFLKRLFAYSSSVLKPYKFCSLQQFRFWLFDFLPVTE